MYRILIFLVLALVRTEVLASDPIIRLPNGLIRGREAKTFKNKTYYAFEKIPYATPPTGHLRFKPPRPAKNWEGVLDARILDVSCYQIPRPGPSINYTESEDCLFISVYTPKLPTSNNKLLPVMVFLYGGSWAFGSSIFYKSEHIIEKDVVYISFNSRNGIFGYLSTQDTVIPGNNGLKDQLLALRWIHENVRLFGGDPSKVTIFGESSGSATVGYFLLNQQSRGLYRAAIMQSGSPLNPWAYQRNARKIAFDVASFLNKTVANSNDSSLLLEFFRSLSAEDLITATVQQDASYTEFPYSNDEQGLQGLIWTPVIEPKHPNAFITEKMYGLIQTGNFVRVPIIIGICSEESLAVEGSNKTYLTSHLATYDQNLDWLVSNDTGVTDKATRTKIGRKIREIYTGGEPFVNHLGDGVRFYSDATFTKAIIRYAALYAHFASTYFYQFSYDGKLGGNDVYYEGAERVGHGEDLNYIFCLPSCNISSFPKPDQVTSERLIQLWTDFAKYLNPTPKPLKLLQNINWPTVDGDFDYLNINETLEIKCYPKQATYPKWVQIYDHLGHNDFDTYGKYLIQLPNGLIRGRKTVTTKNKTYYLFEKIPYATPPVGELRFKAPQPAQNWEGELDATNIDVVCYQEYPVNLTESEDCLFINVYTPKLINSSNEELLPVMIFVHGGAFANGSSLRHRTDRIVDKDVVYVSFNYRVGVFGFLSTQDTVIPGNNGLKDQLLALKWAHNNVNLFGGDPEKITIFGESAGSASVGYILLNQQSQGLYRGAMMQSGSSISPWAFQRNARKIAFKAASFLNESVANSDDSTLLLDLLLSVSAEDIRVAASQASNSIVSPKTEPMFQGLIWSPVIEPKNPDAFITKKMYSLLQAGNIVRVPLVIGICSEESLGLYPRNKDYLLTYLGAYDEHLDWLVSNDTGVTDEANRTEIGSKIRKIYTEGAPFLNNLGDGVRFFSDVGFTKSIIRHASFHSQFAETYFYQFSYNGQMGGNDVHYDGAEYVGHGEDLRYIFCPDNCDISDYPESDQITSERIMELWTNFAKYLNPTPEPSELLQNVTWPVFSQVYSYLNINDTLKVQSYPKDTTYTKWVNIYGSLGYVDFDTY